MRGDHEYARSACLASTLLLLAALQLSAQEGAAAVGIRQNCSQLMRWTHQSWEPTLFGAADVCGESNVKTHMASDGCHNVDARTAVAVCRSVGARLCSEKELENDEPRGTGCGCVRAAAASHTGFR